MDESFRYPQLGSRLYALPTGSQSYMVDEIWPDNFTMRERFKLASILVFFKIIKKIMEVDSR